jgi:hypothetical protein
MICHITFEDISGQHHRIPITVSPTDLAKRWVVKVMCNQHFKDKYIHSAFINQSYKNIDKLQSRLINIVRDINLEYDQQLPLFEGTSLFNETILNELHRHFEVFGGRVFTIDDRQANDGFESSESLRKNFLLLNDLIHTYEEVLYNKDLPIPNMSVLIDYYRATEFEPIQEDDKLHLTTQFMWGGVYLGYATLGKDWLNIALDNDIDVIKRGMVKPQIRMSAETWINFSQDDVKNYTAQEFQQWYLQLPEDVKQLVPISDLNKLSLGRYSIGQVLIDEEYFLKYYNNKSAWQSHNHPIKGQWNNEVFSTFITVTNIQFSG